MDSTENAAGQSLFIVGCGRSGTTLVRLMLDSHPALAIPGESHFIPAMWRNRRRYRTGAALNARSLAADIMRTPHFRQWEIPDAKVWRRIDALERPGFPPPGFPAVVEAVFMAYADHHGKARWGDKTPIYVLSIPLLARLFPSALFVHIIRDGRDVALSYLSVPWGPGTIWQAARKWRRDVSAGCRAGRDLGPGRYLEVRYADLIASPRDVLERICGFASLPYDDAMLEYHRDAGARIQSKPDRTRFHASVTRPPTGGLRNWRAQMPDAHVQAFEAVAGNLLGELGFDRRYPDVPLAIRAEGLVRVQALELLALGSDAKKTVIRAVTRRPPTRAGWSRFHQSRY